MFFHFTNLLLSPEAIRMLSQHQKSFRLLPLCRFRQLAYSCVASRLLFFCSLFDDHPGAASGRQYKITLRFRQPSYYIQQMTTPSFLLHNDILSGASFLLVHAQFVGKVSRGQTNFKRSTILCITFLLIIIGAHESSDRLAK